MSRLGELTAKVDGFFARVQARHGDDMQCGSGCSDCCHVRLTITNIEAQAIRAHVATLPIERRAALADRGVEVDRPADRCAALDADGRCKIYEARPLVCRSHGAPIRMRRGGSVPGPEIESCFRNFTRIEPDADCVLDQEMLSALTLAVDRDAGGTGERVDLAGLVAELASV